jgi:hypothetical protein
MNAPKRKAAVRIPLLHVSNENLTSGPDLLAAHHSWRGAGQTVLLAAGVEVEASKGVIPPETPAHPHRAERLLDIGEMAR